MTTINDLKLTIEFWKWVITLIKSKYTFEVFSTNLIFLCNNGIVILKLTTSNLIKIENINELHSIVYQAIDRINNNDKFFIASNPFKIQKSVEVYDNKNLLEVFPFANYENKTTARLAALQWIFNQGVKDDSL